MEYALYAAEIIEDMADLRVLRWRFTNASMQSLDYNVYSSATNANTFICAHAHGRAHEDGPSSKGGPRGVPVRVCPAGDGDDKRYRRAGCHANARRVGRERVINDNIFGIRSSRERLASCALYFPDNYSASRQTVIIIQ